MKPSPETSPFTIFKDVTTSAQEARAALSKTAAAFNGVGRSPIVGEEGGGKRRTEEGESGEREKKGRGCSCH